MESKEELRKEINRLNKIIEKLKDKHAKEIDEYFRKNVDEEVKHLAQIHLIIESFGRKYYEIKYKYFHPKENATKNAIYVGFHIHPSLIIYDLKRIYSKFELISVSEVNFQKSIVTDAVTFEKKNDK